MEGKRGRKGKKKAQGAGQRPMRVCAGGGRKTGVAMVQASGSSGVCRAARGRPRQVAARNDSGQCDRALHPGVTVCIALRCAPCAAVRHDTRQSIAHFLIAVSACWASAGGQKHQNFLFPLCSAVALVPAVQGLAGTAACAACASGALSVPRLSGILSVPRLSGAGQRGNQTGRPR